MVSSLEAFDAKLREITGMDEKVRPFVCKGSPLDCQVFIVGFNPATANVSFWDFWKPPYGFDKRAWQRAYKIARKAPPLASQGKARGLKSQSNTRQRIECIVQAAHPVKCLETNIYATPSRKQKDLRKESQLTKVFDFLLEYIQPRVVFVHGAPAVEHMRRKLGLAELKPPEYTWTSRRVGDMILVAGSHLAIGWSLEKATELGKELRARCGE